MGGRKSGQKGTRYERELVTALHAAGFGSMRLPSSGSATKRELPDLLVGRPMPDADHHTGRPTSFLWAIEAKSGDATTLYVKQSEVDDLTAFAERWGARPLLSARFTTNGTPTDHYLVEPDAARITPQGNYGLPVDDVAERAFAVVDTKAKTVTFR